ncbi:MAG: hypothetical protein AB8G05_26225 [Oligoflexales bacterium]
MYFRNMLTLILLTVANTGAFAITCDSFQWQDVSKVRGIYKFTVSQRCNLGYSPNISLEEVNQIVIKQKKQMASKIFTEDVNHPDYVFSSKERLSLRKGEVYLLSKNFALINESDVSQFRSDSEVLKATDKAKYIESLKNVVLSKKTSNNELLVKVGTTLYLNKPPLVPIDLLKKKIKEDMEEDLSRYAGELHEAISAQLKY